MRLLAPAALCLGLTVAAAAPAVAFDIAALSPTERTAFGEAVRAYLLDNPEVLMEAIGVLEQRHQTAQADADRQFLRDNAATIFDNPADWAGGNLQGDITVVEFIDYRCTYCRRAADEVAELVASDGNIRLVMKEFPVLGPDSLTSAKFAIAVRNLAGDTAYKTVHDGLLDLKGPPSDAALAELAAGVGLEMAALRDEMDSPAVTGTIHANQQLASMLEINGTPTFIVKETLVRGYVPLNGMRQIVAGQRDSVSN